MSSKTSTYRVVEDSAGCEKCGHGRTWMVIGPDGYGSGQSFFSEGDAEDLADMLNMAGTLSKTFAAAGTA